MGACRIESISEAHEKGGTLSLQAIVNEGIEVNDTVKQVGGGAEKGVQRPCLNIRVVGG